MNDSDNRAQQTILVIDDCDEDRMVYRRLLTQESEFGYEILEAESGTKGLELVRSSRPDCVLLDYHLPDMDGLEVVDELKGDQQEPIVPVILLTGQGSEPIAVKAMRAGVADYIRKGQVSSKVLFRAIENTIEKHRLKVAVREHRRDLEKAVERLRLRNSEIRNFYHTLSHELKSPLTAATEFIALVLEGLAGPINDTQEEYLETAKHNCHRMTTHINDILDVSRLETGKMSLSREEIRIERLTEELVTTFSSKAKDAGIVLRLSCAEELPSVYIDEHRIVQVMSNLLSNAIKFTPQGGEISIRVDTRDDQVDRVFVAVRDTGRGIAAEKLPLVFERLYQVCEGDSAGLGGLGMGLHICKDLVELHGGTIEVESEEGVGSTFTFCLPTAAGRPRTSSRTADARPA